MNVEPTTRRANFWLFVGLVLFAVALCVLVLMWMRTRTHAQGGKVFPPVSVFLHPSTPLPSARDDRSFAG